MKTCVYTRRGIEKRVAVFVILASVCLCFQSSLLVYGSENSSITLEKSKDKTVYAIGPNEKDESKEDTDKAWEMLKGVIIDSRGSRGKGSDNNR